MKSLLAVLLLAPAAALADPAPLVVSGFLTNPAGTDSPYEYVQIIATQTINFSSTPYSVVWANNGTASVNGWAAGGSLSYGFNLTTGTVVAGDVIYVGGSAQLINGVGSTSISGATWLRTINTGTTAGDGFGTAASAGVFGNGGTNADGIGIFSGLASGITTLSVPVDAVFYGGAIGSAYNAGTGAGYRVPANDLYAGGGLFGSAGNTMLLNDPGSGDFVRLNGAYDRVSGTFTTARTGSIVALTTTSSLDTIAPQLAVVPEPTTIALAGVGLAALIGARRLRRPRVR